MGLRTNTRGNTVPRFDHIAKEKTLPLKFAFDIVKLEAKAL